MKHITLDQLFQEAHEYDKEKSKLLGIPGVHAPTAHTLLRELVARVESRIALTDTPEQPESGECEHEEGCKQEHDNIGTYHVGSETCCKCGAHMNDWKQPTQEIEPLNLVQVEREHDAIGYGSFSKSEAIENKINELIDAVNALQKGDR